MNIRLLTPNDWEKFCEIRLAGIKTDAQAFGSSFAEMIQRKESEWRKRLGTADRFFFAAEENDIFVSVAGAKKTSETSWMLVAVHTLPEFRGRGYAQQLTASVLDELKKRGARTVQLMVNVDQVNAVHIYKKAGFKIIKTLKDEIMGDGKPHDEYVMEKHIQ